jgi:hypothetical protein
MTQTAMPDVIAELRRIARENSAIAALTMGNVFAGQLPLKVAQTPAKKAVVIRADGGPAGVGNTAVSQQRVAVYCYGETHAEAAKVSRTVAYLFKYSERIGQQAFVHGINPAGGFIQGVDPSTKWPFIWQTWTALSSDEEIA